MITINKRIYINPEFRIKTTPLTSSHSSTPTIKTRTNSHTLTSKHTNLSSTPQLNTQTATHQGSLNSNIFNHHVLSHLNRNDYINMCHWNANHLSNKTHMLHDFIQSSDPDIICLNEHCFSEEYANYAFSQFKNFNTIYSCRNSRSGGGTAIMIKNTLRYTSVKWTTSHANLK